MSFRVVGIGELLWDLLPDGSKLGGAPANFTYHSCALGAEGRLISRVGTDPMGDEALARLSAIGVPVDCIERDAARPTGSVSVELERDGQPKYTIHENVAWDAITGEAHGGDVASKADAVCFGTLAQRSEISRNTIRRLVEAAPSTALRILDVNLRSPFFSREVIETSLELANVVKLNETELPVVAEMLDLSGDERRQISSLADRFDLRCVAYTRGARGSLLWSAGEWSEMMAPIIQVADTIGAGDSFTAAMVLGLLARWPLEQIHTVAAELAAFVCTQTGGTPALPAAFRSQFGR